MQDQARLSLIDDAGVVVKEWSAPRLTNILEHYEIDGVTYSVTSFRWYTDTAGTRRCDIQVSALS